MKLDSTSHIRYVSDLGTVSRYELVIADRLAMLISVDRNDPNQAITVARHDGTGVIVTDGRYSLRAGMIEDADGSPIGMAPTRPSATSIYRYVLLNLPHLLVQLYVPTN